MTSIHMYLSIRFVTGIGYHCYGTSNLSFAETIRKKYPELFIMMTECCQGFTTKPPNPLPKAVLGDWGQAAGYISGVINVSHDFTVLGQLIFSNSRI